MAWGWGWSKRKVENEIEEDEIEEDEKKRINEEDEKKIGLKKMRKVEDEIERIGFNFLTLYLINFLFNLFF